MSKRRFRIDGGRYGGELTLGEINPEFARYWQPLTENNGDSDLIEYLLSDQEDDLPKVLLDEDAEVMWHDIDELEHLNAAYADGGFTVTEVTGLDDFDYNESEIEIEGYHLYSREGGYFGEEPEDLEEYVPVLCFHSSEKGNFCSWFVETDGEDFDPKKFAFGSCETNLAELVDRVYYDGVELESNYDRLGTTGKGYYADVGWLNTKWRDSSEHYEEGTEYMQDAWESYRDCLEDE